MGCLVEFLAAVVVIPASFGLALLLQVGALKIILWVLQWKSAGWPDAR